MITELQRQRRREASARYKKRHPERHAERNRRDYAKHREARKAAMRAYHWKNRDVEVLKMRKHYHENRETIRRARNASKYGITLEEYDSLFVIQGGVCALCGEPSDSEGRLLSVDHCHDTGKVRGLLCSSCNMGIGIFDDDIASLEKAIAYLRSHQQKEQK